MTSETIRDHFGDLWPVHNRGFTLLLIKCRELCEGDLDQVLILSAIGMRTLMNRRIDGLTYDEFLDGRRSAGVSRKINLQCIADGTGIPRETVRRKIKCLMARGWIEKESDGTLAVTARAADELAPATQATFDYLRDIANTVLSITSATDGTSRPTGR
ncbi:MAG: hypothetical protein PVI83_07410 [Lysobacterales bacterium]